jgi:TM2 domain-containing membrane protein YozV
VKPNLEIAASLSSEENTMKDSLPANEISRHRNLVAAILSSVVPGLGQFYKGHPWEGGGIILNDFAVAIWVGTLLSLSYAEDALLTTLGVSNGTIGFLFNPVTIFLGVMYALGFWALVVFDAYDEAALHEPLPSRNPTRILRGDKGALGRGLRESRHLGRRAGFSARVSPPSRSGEFRTASLC